MLSTPWPIRWARMLRQRALRAWRAWRGQPAWPSFPAAAEWLQQQTGPMASGRYDLARAETLAQVLPTAWAIGLEGLAREMARRLVAMQQGDGSLPDASGSGPSIWNTAQFVRGLLACEGLDDRAALPACEYLRTAMTSMDRSMDGGTGSEPVPPPAVSLAAMAALAAGARRWSRPEWGAVVLSVLERERKRDRHVFQAEAARGGCLSPAEAARKECQSPADEAEAWLDLNRPREAARLLKDAERRLTRDGLLPDMPDRAWTDTARLVQWITLWSRAGRSGAARSALQRLADVQRPDGSWPAAIGPGAPGGDEDLDGRLAATAGLLRAVLAQVAAAFEEPASLPIRIDPSDGRAAAVVDWLGRLPATPQVADVGCGRGRFLRLMAERVPGARLTGFDVSPAMLAQLPAEVVRRRGSLLHIPAAEAAFDGALAVESLEHALWPRQAVAELCRIVRPGGRVLILDKHRDKQARSLCDPWEQWFAPDELRAWLSAFCDEVRVTPVPHLEGRPAADLFLAAEGRKR